MIMKLFTRGGKYCSTSAECSKAHMLQSFPPQVQSHDNSTIFIYFMTKVLDTFHSAPMVMTPWVDYENYPTLGSLIE